MRSQISEREEKKTKIHNQNLVNGEGHSQAFCFSGPRLPQRNDGEMSEGDRISLKARLRASISDVAVGLERILDETSGLVRRDGAKEFADNHVKKCGGAIKLYHELFTSYGVQSRKELMGVSAPFYADADFREVVDDLLDVEERYDEFLGSVDTTLRDEVNLQNTEYLIAGSDAPVACTLQDLTLSLSSGKPLGECSVSLNEMTSSSEKSTLLIMLRHLS